MFDLNKLTPGCSIAIAGSRKVSDKDSRLMYDLLAVLITTYDPIFSHGGQVGFDLLVEDVAKVMLSQHNVKCYIPWENFNSKSLLVSDPKSIISTLALTQSFPELREKSDKLLEEYYFKYRSRNVAESVRLLMSRNNFVILGTELNSTPDLLITCSPISKVDDSSHTIVDTEGGTGYATRLSYGLEIPNLNLSYEPHRKVINKFISDKTGG